MTIENSIISEVFNDDCIEGMKRTPDKFHDLAVCDVQYGIGVGKMAYLTEVKKTVTQKNGTKLSINKTIHTKKDWDSSPPPPLERLEAERDLLLTRINGVGSVYTKNVWMQAVNLIELEIEKHYGRK